MSDSGDSIGETGETDDEPEGADGYACTYCGCDVTTHEPVTVTEGVGRGDDAGRVPAGQFCNYGCLVAHVEAEGLVEGSTCRVEL